MDDPRTWTPSERLARLEVTVYQLLQPRVDDDHDRLVNLERARERDDARDEARATVAVRAARKGAELERRRWAAIGTLIALVAAVSPHVHLPPPWP